MNEISPEAPAIQSQHQQQESTPAARLWSRGASHTKGHGTGGANTAPSQHVNRPKCGVRPECRWCHRETWRRQLLHRAAAASRGTHTACTQACEEAAASHRQPHTTQSHTSAHVTHRSSRGESSICFSYWALTAFSNACFHTQKPTLIHLRVTLAGLFFLWKNPQNYIKNIYKKILCQVVPHQILIQCHQIGFK